MSEAAIACWELSAHLFLLFTVPSTSPSRPPHPSPSLSDAGLNRQTCLLLATWANSSLFQAPPLEPGSESLHPFLPKPEHTSTHSCLPCCSPAQRLAEDPSQSRLCSAVCSAWRTVDSLQLEQQHSARNV